MCVVNRRIAVVSALCGVGLMAGAACSSPRVSTEPADTPLPTTGASIAEAQPSDEATRAPPDRPLVGTLVMSGGPYPGRVVPVPGRVRADLVSGGASPVITMADGSGRFVLHLPDGRYRLSGTSPRYNAGEGACQGGEVLIVGDTVQRDDAGAAGTDGLLLVACPMK
jgi:hypothetical protein